MTEKASSVHLGMHNGLRARLALMLPCRRGHAAACLQLVVTLLVILSFAHPAAAAPATPRCGVEDNHSVPISPDGGAGCRFTFLQGKPRWARRPAPLVLTYAASPTATVSYLPPDGMRDAFRRAFERWALVIPVSFVETDDYDAADIKLGFYKGSHGDGSPFGGSPGQLGHALYTTGRIHLDATQHWALDFNHGRKKQDAFDLESVTTHEIGHVLGLGHSTSPKAVMYPTIKPLQKKARLTLDDVEGMQLLYGSNPNFSISSLDTSMSPERSAWVTSSARLVVGAVLVILLATHL